MFSKFQPKLKSTDDHEGKGMIAIIYLFLFIFIFYFFNRLNHCYWERNYCSNIQICKRLALN